MDGLINEWMDWWMNGWIDKWMDGLMNEWMLYVIKKTNEWTDKSTYKEIVKDNVYL